MNSIQQTNPQTFKIGGNLNINRLGYGAMRLTGQPGNYGPYADWEGGKELLRRAVELGINFIDTAEAYGPGTNEDIIADALYLYPEDLVIATKGGIHKPAPDTIQADGRPDSLQQGVEGSLQRLKKDRIDLYQLHRPDPKVPFAESIQALAELQQEGKIRHIGISNVPLAQIQEAQAITAIASVQNRFSLLDRSHEEILNYCTQQQIAFIPYGSLGANPLKRGAPLTTPEEVADQQIASAIGEIANRHTIKPSQVVLAWLLHRAPNILLIPGTITIAHLEENGMATEISLSQAEIAALN